MTFKIRGSVGGSIERKLKIDGKVNENRTYLIKSIATHRNRRHCKKSYVCVRIFEEREHNLESC